MITAGGVGGRPVLTPVEVVPGFAEPPRRVLAVCLPFVIVKEARNSIDTLDVRRVTLFRWPKRTARLVRRAARSRGR